MNRSRQRTAVCLVAAGLAMVALGGHARAEKRIALAEFTGPKAAELKRSVASVVDEKYQVVAAGKVAAALKERGSPSDEESWQELAIELGADAFLEGTVSERKREYSLTLTLREGATGKVASELKVSLGRTPKWIPRAGREVTFWLRVAVPQLAPLEKKAGTGGDSSSGETEPEGDTPPDRTGTGAGKTGGTAAGKTGGTGAGWTGGTGAGKTGGTAAGGTGGTAAGKTGGTAAGKTGGTAAGKTGGTAAGKTGGTSGSGEGATSGTSEAPTRTASAGDQAGSDDLSDADFGTVAPSSIVTTGVVDEQRRSTPALHFSGGMVASRRRLSFETKENESAARPDTYEGDWNPKVAAALEFYPLRWWLDDSAWRGLGVIASYERTVEQAMDPAPDTEQNILLALSYRLQAGSEDDGPSFTGLGGFSHRKSTVADTSLEVPGVAYRAGVVGLDVRVPIGTPAFALLTDTRFFAVATAGEIRRDQSYGNSTVLGVELGGALELIVFRNIAVRVGGRYSSYALEFDGTGALSTGIVAARDRYLSANASAGILLY